MTTPHRRFPADVATATATPQPRIVADLLRADAYPGWSSSGVELRQTHASWVFLTDDDVFKLKRPVDLGFLDYRTLEARREACEEEVRLNRRLAPEVYLGVEPVRLEPAGHHLGGRGDIVDWAVHMRRLPDAASAEALLAAGRLTSGHLEALAVTMARFLDAAPSAPRYGTQAILRANVAQNMAQSFHVAVAPGFIDLRTLEDIRRFQDQELRLRVDRFADRIKNGRIRDGHGDLRLEHVYFVPSGTGVESPVVIDCVEFSEAFRAGDVASEIAFLAMELESAERADLAGGFIARCAEALDDYDLYGVLDFYLCYRANIRAKVAAMVAVDPLSPAALRMQKRTEAQRRFALARACAGRSAGTPALIAVGGVIGSGKSTLASALGRALGAPVIGSDRTRKSLAGMRTTERGDEALYTPERTEATYVELVRRAEVVLQSGRTAILDATFDRSRWRELAGDVARAFGATFAFVEASCPDWEALRARVRSRDERPSESDAGETLLDRYVAAGKAPSLGSETPHIVIDTRQAAPAIRERALTELAKVGISAPPGREWPGPIGLA
ncbi:MAG TPA: AAA family ATPase [Polyangia bacterium]|jgi:hypothetical protein